MSDVMKTIATSVVLSAIASTLLTSLLQTRRDRFATRWEMKRATCLQALDLVDGLFSNISWDQSYQVLPQEKPSMVELRRCHNELALTCANPDVVKFYRRCLGLDGPLSADAVVDLPTAIRAELGFGKPIETDRSGAFLGYISGSTEADALTPPPSAP